MKGVLTPIKLWAVLLALGLLLVATIACCTAVGSQRVELGRALFGELPREAGFFGQVGAALKGLFRPAELADPELVKDRAILLQVRLPRVLLAAAAGMALVWAGVTFQALLRNPLADPYILGVCSGAALGSILGRLIGRAHFADSHLWAYASRVAPAFLGALLAISIVYYASQVKGRTSRHTLLLVGVVVNALFGATIMFLTTILDLGELRGAMLWLMGTISDFNLRYDVLMILVLITLASGVLLYKLAPEFNLLAAGEEAAGQMGVAVEKAKRRAFIIASFVTAAVVAVTGPIGFVGLIVPHIMRLIVGADHRILLPAAGLFGGAFLVACDTLARTISPTTQMPVGVITAMCGGPFFIFLLKRFQRRAFFD